MKRRTYILCTSVLCSSLLGGCLGSDGKSNAESIVETYYKEQERQNSLAEYRDAVEGILHSESQIHRALQSEPYPLDLGEIEIASVNPETANEDVSEEELRQDFGLSEPRDPVEALADENFFVTPNVSYANQNRAATVHLTATENDEWKIYF